MIYKVQEDFVQNPPEIFKFFFTHLYNMNNLKEIDFVF